MCTLDRSASVQESAVWSGVSIFQGHAMNGVDGYVAADTTSEQMLIHACIGREEAGDHNRILAAYSSSSADYSRVCIFKTKARQNAARSVSALETLPIRYPACSLIRALFNVVTSWTLIRQWCFHPTSPSRVSEMSK
jgi:hypothetical protein